MNNEQFRKLVASNQDQSARSKDGSASSGATPKVGALGSRQRASIPMTPRAVGNSQVDFARQLAERNQASRPQKKFRTSAPRGVKYGDGYVDRSQERHEEDSDDRAERLKNLEELLKKEEIDQATYDKMRYQIAGGDLSSTHLVKGLDFKLLQRVREGEDVYGEKRTDPAQETGPEENVDEEFDKLEQQDVQAVVKEKGEKKKGTLSTVTLAPGKKRSRDQILAELRASREAAAKAAEEASLGSRFKKVGAKQTPSTRIERDGKGREVMIIVDENGNEKRKVRKIQPGQDVEEAMRNNLPMPDKAVAPLGMEVPAQYKQQQAVELEVEEDVDIFADVGDDYDPLAGMDDSGSDSEDGETKDKGEEVSTKRDDGEGEISSDTKAMPPPPKPAAPRNYFQGSKKALVSEELGKGPAMSDEAMMAAIKRAAAIKRTSQDDDDDDESEEARRATKAREERRRQMLQGSSRDEEDMDMGFGTSRFEDEEDFDESQVKLSAWGDEDDGEQGSKGGQKRKRGPKKRKGDANSAADVLRVMEERKKP